MSQTNIHLFTTRTNGRYKGLLEVRAQWLESLERYYTMKTLSDTPKTFTFTYTFKDFDTAQVAGHALIGYITGTYEQPAIEVSYHNDEQGGVANCLAVEYIADTELTETFQRICDSFKDYYNNPEEFTGEDLDDYEQEQEIEQEYIRQRTEQLEQSETFESLPKKVVRLELELMELADSVLDDDYPDMAVNGVWENMEAVDRNARALLKELDTESNYCALWKYSAEYTSDEDLTESFKRITNSLDHTDDYEDYEDHEPETFRLSYHGMRVSQLQELDKDTLINDIIAYELELLDHANRLLSDEPLPLDSQHGYETIELLGDEVIDLVKKLDTDKQFDRIHDYIVVG